MLYFYATVPAPANPNALGPDGVIPEPLYDFYPRRWRERRKP